MRLRQCSRCSGFVARGRCPHCGARVRWRLWKLVALLGGSATAMTLMACYGSPCVRSNDTVCHPPPDDLSATPIDLPPPDVDGGANG
jgi:hypothetical protein